MTGTQFGVYRIRSLLGSGGMGEVYRAEDTRLGREVAIKFLPQAFTSDPDRLARFEREARVLASLNHPNIAAIHGIEEAPSTVSGPTVRALVLELVEGQTLSERIEAGLTITDALVIARQIVEALDGAHEKGIVHRDLKPANIKITPDGVVKVLDFGLAKPATAYEGVSDASKSPTAIAPMTLDGALLGTAAYMSPEQARSKPVDKRTDIWAFGCVLFEMLTKRAAFGGGTVPDIVAAILEREPNWQLVPPRTPASVRTLLARCLEKDVKRRLRDIADALPELDATTRSTFEPGVTAPPRAPGVFGVVPWLIAGAAVTAAVVMFSRPAPAGFEPQPTRRFSIVAPPGMILTPRDASAQPQFVLSPDGSRIAYVAARRGEGSRLWVQTLESSAVQAVQGSEDALGPFWSYDSRSLAYFARGKLKKVALDGGPPQDLADVVPDVNGGTWNQDDIIVFGGPPGSGLLRVSANGGPVAVAAALDASRRETGYRWPEFLPDGRRFLFYVRSSSPATSGVYIGSLDDQSKTQVLTSIANAVFSSSGHLLFEQNGTLAAQSFDAATGTLTGAPISLGDSIRGNIGSAYLPLSLSRDGTLAYWVGEYIQTELLWIDRSGRPLGTVGTLTNAANPSMSPDGERLLFTEQVPGTSNTTDMWRLDLKTGVKSRLTFSGLGRFGIWSADGRSVVFSTLVQLFEKPSAGGDDTPVTGTGNHYAIFPEAISRDGTWLLYTATGETGWDVWGLSLNDRKARPIIEAPASQVQASLSPDGRWLAYASDETGSWEVYAQPFPAGAGKWQVSAGGGSQPRWRGDGREIYYVNREGQLTTVPVKGGSTFEIGARQVLFQTRVGTMLAPFRINYDVSPDGQRFLINSPLTDSDPTRITIVLNWQGQQGTRTQ